MGMRDFCRQKRRLALRQCPTALARTLEALGPLSVPIGAGSSMVIDFIDCLSNVTVKVKLSTCSRVVVNSVSKLHPILAIGR
jgi:hypothetical protein